MPEAHNAPHVQFVIKGLSELEQKRWNFRKTIVFQYLNLIVFSSLFSSSILLYILTSILNFRQQKKRGRAGQVCGGEQGHERGETEEGEGRR